MSYQPIENHGVIGDMKTAALVGMDGSIDFMCFPDFDSPTIFASLLDSKNGGRFQIAPVESDGFQQRQLYFPDTNILLTRFLAEEGVAEVSDFMAIDPANQHQALVRRVKVVRGTLNLRMTCAPRFDYGRVKHTIEKHSKEIVFTSKGKDRTALRLRSRLPITVSGGDAVVNFKLKAGAHEWFILEDAGKSSESPCAHQDYVADSFKETMNFWLAWIRKSQYRGRWKEMVNRSALTLKLLTSKEKGSLIAAPTFGLPEVIGGTRNWDYRYTWIRDASFTLYGLMRLGYTEEAADFMGWIEKRCHELGASKQLQVMYGIDGRTELPETELKQFEGYRKSSPIRIGNGAANQLQLDIYGELLDSVYLYNKYGKQISYDFWQALVKMVDWVCDNWHRRDFSIWEERGVPRNFLYSKVLCWVAIDRGMRLAVKRSFPAPLDKWRRVRNKIYHEVYEKYWNPKLKAFVQFKGATVVDASSLLMPMLKFISPNDPRWCSHLATIEKTLVEDSQVYRYDTLRGADDGLPGREGTFSMCSFWYAECLARSGDLKKARFIFEKAISYANHLGLFAEEISRQGEHLGNFPQAFTHLSLISTAWNLDQRLDGGP